MSERLLLNQVTVCDDARDEKLVLHRNAHWIKKACVKFINNSWDYPNVMQYYVTMIFKIYFSFFLLFIDHCTRPIQDQMPILQGKPKKIIVQHVKVNFAPTKM